LPPFFVPCLGVGWGVDVREFRKFREDREFREGG
jgi:hypothetical protein